FSIATHSMAAPAAAPWIRRPLLRQTDGGTRRQGREWGRQSSCRLRSQRSRGRHHDRQLDRGPAVRLNRVLAIVAAVAALLAGGLAIFVYTLDVDRYRDVIAAEAKALTGRDLEIGGRLQLDLFAAAPALVAETVSLANAPWGSEPEMIRVRRIELRVRLAPLLSGKVEIARLVLVEPHILLEIGPGGRPNWRFEPPGGAAPSAGTGDGSGALPSLGDIRIDHARIVYRDGASGSVGEMRLESATLEAIGPEDPVELAVRGAIGQRPIELEGTFGPLADLMAGGSYGGRFSGRFGKSDIAG